MKPKTKKIVIAVLVLLALAILFYLLREHIQFTISQTNNMIPSAGSSGGGGSAGI